MMKRIIYGTSSKADIILRGFGDRFDYFVDQDSSKWGKILNGLPIYSPERLLEENKDDVEIIIALTKNGHYYRSVSTQLEQWGFIEGKHFKSMTDCYPEHFPYEELTTKYEYAPWKTDQDFLEIYNKVREYTLVEKARLFGLWSYVEQVAHLEGVIIEVGVWRGGTGAVLAHKANMCGIKERVYLCDTFTGVVKADSSYDIVYKGGEHDDTSLELVDDLIMNQLKLKNVSLLQGIFPDDTGNQVLDQKVKLCHIDVDVYLSAKHVFEWVWDRMVVGGVVIFDDYGLVVTNGVTNYVNNELKSRNDLFFIYNLNGQAIIIKIK